MGGYGFYVWSAYLITFLVLAANLMSSWRKKTKLMRQLERRESTKSYPANESQ